MAPIKSRYGVLIGTPFKFKKGGIVFIKLAFAVPASKRDHKTPFMGLDILNGVLFIVNKGTFKTLILRAGSIFSLMPLPTPLYPPLRPLRAEPFRAFLIRGGG